MSFHARIGSTSFRLAPGVDIEKILSEHLKDYADSIQIDEGLNGKISLYSDLFIAEDSLRDQLDVFTKVISPYVLMPFKIDLTDLDNSFDNQSHFYAGPDEKSVNRFIKHEGIKTASDAINSIKHLLPEGISAKLIDQLNRASNSDLVSYQVVVTEIDATDQTVFECSAEDGAHAIEQAIDAHPECEVISVEVAPEIVIDKDDVREFMLDRIENGYISLDELPAFLTTYGLMESDDFIEQMKEQMKAVEFGKFAESISNYPVPG